MLSKSRPAVRERGPHHQRVEYISTVRDDLGRVHQRTNSYVVLGTGLNRWDDTRQEWVAASDRIELINGHGVVRGAQHRVVLAPNTRSRGGLVDLKTPWGERIVLQPVGLAVTDAAGRSVFLAEVKASAGELVAPNVMLYRDAFDLLAGAISIRVTLDGVESDVILSERVDRDLIARLGVDVETAKLEIWHRVLDKPRYKKGVARVKRRSGREDEDHTVAFGGMSITEGTAFSIGPNARRPAEQGVHVAKEFVQVEGADYLIESVPFLEAEPEMQGLPPAMGAAFLDLERWQSAFASGKRTKEGRNYPESLAEIASKTAPRRLAMNQPGTLPSGYVIDYPITLSTHTDFTFQGDTTYYIASKVFLHGVTRLEGGAVIKTAPYDPEVQASIRVMGDFQCATTPFNPAIFTARDDDTVGEPVAESTGAVGDSWYSQYNLYLDGPNPVQVHDIQTRHGYVGLFIGSPGSHDLWNLQVYRCSRGINLRNTAVRLRNTLIEGCAYALDCGAGATRIEAEHLTVDSADLLFRSGRAGMLHLTNSLLCDVGSVGVNVVSERVEMVGPSVFQRVGHGRHYLPPGSPHRDAGTTGISTEMASLLKETTTYGPTMLSGNITANFNLVRFAPRDVDLPDLGYHYFPLDYWASSVVVDGATLTIGPGVNVGGAGQHVFTLKNEASFVSAGTSLERNAIVPVNAAQCEVVNGGAPIEGMFRLESAIGRFELQFTDFAMLATEPQRRLLLSGFADSANVPDEIILSHSRLANLAQGFRAAEATTVRLENNIIERCSFNFEQGSFRRANYAPLNLEVRNNLFYDGTIFFIARAGTTPWIVRDNFFHSDTILASGLNSNFAPDFNAFRTGLRTIGGPNNQADIEPAFRSGPLGEYYYDTSGSMGRLIDAGSQPAGGAALAHFTTDPAPLASEGTSTVDIGFHYAALDASGGLPDSDGDSILDTEEDRNGNGTKDPGETSHLDRDSDFDGEADDYELSAGHDPASAESVEWKSLASWRFDSGDLVSVEGIDPVAVSNVTITNAFGVEAADFSSTGQPVILQYPGLEGSGRLNVSLAQGSIRLRIRTHWFSKDPSLNYPGLTFGGVGPGEWITLVETTNLAVRIDPDGTNLFVLSRSANGPWTTNAQRRIVIESDQARTNVSAPGNSFWHDLLVTYSPRETTIFWTAPHQPVIGAGIEPWQGKSSDNKVLSVGSRPDGSGKINALLDHVVIYNIPGVLQTNPWVYSAIARTDPPSLNIVWPGATNLLVDIKRRKLGEADWQWISPAVGTNFVDGDVVPGERYEYNLNAGFLHFTGVPEPFGHPLTASVLGSAMEKRGKLILLVDETLAAGIEPEAGGFITNLVGDGWTVLRANMPRQVDDYSSTAAFATNWFNITNRIAPFIRSNYSRFPDEIKHLLIVGHVTIPYAGDQADDGHWTPPGPSNPLGSHQGAWASDLYYSDMDGIWRDTKMVNWSAFPENWNSPGDGKLDEDYIPANSEGDARAEITVARIDFSRLPAFSQNETELLKRYLQKNHRYRHKELTFEPNAIGQDLFFGFQSVTHPEHMARQFGSKLAVLNPGVIGDVFASPGSYVFGAQSGSGWVDRINSARPQQQTTEDFAANRTSPDCAFYLLRGSFFQDWNLENSFMKAILTPANGGLASGWFMTMGVWRFDQLATGLELGSGWLEAVNSSLKPFWGGQSARATQILGDSTLRYPVLAPPSDLTLDRVERRVNLSWTPSPEGGCRYYVYRANAGLDSTFWRLTSEPLAETTFTDSPPPRATPTYMIKAVKVTETGGGSFTNLSQGVFKVL